MIGSNWIAAAVGIGVALTAVTSASAQERGATCMRRCEAYLEKSGLWRAYPYGHCRRQCGYQAPAEKYRR